MSKPETYHFIGIGGIGMSALAQILHGRGHEVRGSDQMYSKTVALLQKQGIRVFIGHAAKNVEGANVVVRSTAISQENIELIEAGKMGIRVMHRAQLLAQLAAGFRSVAVAGMHGKTTTTNMIFHVFKASGIDAVLISGGIDLEQGSNAYVGKDPVLVFEADESDGSLVLFHPHSAVLTNLEEEHMGYYKDLAQIRNVFKDFASHVQAPGCVAYNLDDANLVALERDSAVPFASFSLRAKADIYASNVQELQGQEGKIRFDVWEGSNKLGSLSLGVAGTHNVANALAAISIARRWEIGFDAIRRGLEGFRGTMRRLELKGRIRGIDIIDDYAHHPTEVRASLQALAAGKRGKLVVVFQPHRYSRVSHMGDDFARSFMLADEVVIMPIFSAGESNPQGVSSEDLVAKIKHAGHEHVRAGENFPKVAEDLAGRLGEGDIVVGMGAGDIEKFAPLMKNILTAKHSEAHLEASCS